MKCVSPWIGTIAALAVCFSDANAQMFDQEDQIVDEIVSIGIRPAGFFFGSLGGWLSWSILDIGDINGDFGNLGNSLSNLLDAMNDASEEVCRQRVENWRSSCHRQMNINRNLCLTANLFLLGGPIRLLMPREYYQSATFGIGVVGGSRCHDWDRRAHENCNAIADSDSAPRIAQCD